MAMNGHHSQLKDSEATEMIYKETRPNQYTTMGAGKHSRTTCSWTIVVLFIVSMILVVVGISLIIVSSSRKTGCEKKSEEPDNTKYCGFSKEAQRSGFDTFLHDLQREFFRLHPHQSYHDPTLDYGNEIEVLSTVYKPFNPSPDNLKTITDASLALLKRLNALKVNENRLKPRERRTLIQAKYFLKHTFGQPYDMNYYAADWMLGPNHFCWQPICDIPRDIFYHLDYYKPIGIEGLKSLR